MNIVFFFIEQFMPKSGVIGFQIFFLFSSFSLRKTFFFYFVHVRSLFYLPLESSDGHVIFSRHVNLE